MFHHALQGLFSLRVAVWGRSVRGIPCTAQATAIVTCLPWHSTTSGLCVGLIPLHFLTRKHPGRAARGRAYTPPTAIIFCALRNRVFPALPERLTTMAPRGLNFTCLALALAGLLVAAAAQQVSGALSTYSVQLIYFLQITPASAFLVASTAGGAPAAAP